MTLRCLLNPWRFTAPFLHSGKASVDDNLKIKVSIDVIDEYIRYLPSSNPEGSRFKAREINKRITVQQHWKEALLDPANPDILIRFNEVNQNLEDFIERRNTPLKQHQDIRAWDNKSDQTSRGNERKSPDGFMATAAVASSLVGNALLSSTTHLGGVRVPESVRPYGMWANLFRAGHMAINKAAEMVCSYPYASATTSFGLLNMAKYNYDKRAQLTAENKQSPEEGTSFQAGVERFRHEAGDKLDVISETDELQPDNRPSSLTFHDKRMSEEAAPFARLSRIRTPAPRPVNPPKMAAVAPVNVSSLSTEFVADSPAEQPYDETSELSNSADEMASMLADWLKKSVL